ncbi:MAG: DUF2330 domain-containing protein [Myxococcota bacterium]
MPAAEACGGFFCDTPAPDGTPMAVDQTGENLLFVVGDGFVEAHVQIEYTADEGTESFAWIIPVPALPEVEVGSDQLLANVLDASVPVYGFETEDLCEDSNDDGQSFLIQADGANGGTGVVVVAKDTVGAFEYVALQGGTSESIMTWLFDNGYAQDDAAPEILDAYIDQGSIFLAFRLDHSEGIDDIHPLVIRYPGTEPCIPLRLTAIAASDDMRVRALLLGESRAYPVNYDHVQLNRVRLDWDDDASNYDALVTGAVDEAGGRAFVTEYAGPSDIIGGGGLSTADLDPDVFETLSPLGVIDALEAQGLLVCSSTCAPAHPLIGGLLARYLPSPTGVAPEKFYG